MRVVFTGGGTAGHVLPNIAVLEHMRARASKKTAHKQEIEVLYIGSKKGPEKAICERYDVPFVGVATGKLRRYFSVKNLVDPFRVVAGVFQAWRILRKWKPDVVFSKGGFVSVPVVLAAAKLKVPVVLHEADVEPGLANRICVRFARVICVSWQETMKFFSRNMVSAKVLHTGMPVRREVVSGVREKGLQFLGFDGVKPILLVMGGSLGAKSLNSLVWESLEVLTKTYDVVHLTGGGADSSLVRQLEKRLKGYRAYPYLQDELFDVYAASDVVVSRAGASAIAELCVLGKPTVLVPLGTSQSRGDQMVNANVLHEAGACEIYFEERRSASKFSEVVCALGVSSKKRDALSGHMRVFGECFSRAAGQLAELIAHVK